MKSWWKRNWRLVVLGAVLGAYIVEFVAFLMRTEGARDVFYGMQFLVSCVSMLAYFGLAMALHTAFDPVRKLWYRGMNGTAAAMTAISLYMLLSPVVQYGMDVI